MRPTTRFALAAIAASFCAFAQAAAPSDADRREQNVDSALAKWRAEHPTLARNDTRAGTPARGEKTTLREKTHNAAEKTRGVTHRQLNKVRNFTDEQNAKFEADKAKRP